MATVVMTSPRNGGTYQTDATGALVAFPARGYCDTASFPVSLYEDSTGALLGSASSDATPETQGAYAGWYAWTIWVYSWTSSAGLGLPPASGAGSVGGIGLKGALGVPGVSATGAAASFLISTANNLALPAGQLSSAAASFGVTAVAGLPGASATGTAAFATITAGGGGGGPASDDFNRADAADLGSNWTQIPGTAARWSVTSNSAYASSAVIRGDYRTGTFNGNHYSEAASVGSNGGYPVAVRCQSDQHSCYYVAAEGVDEGDGWYSVNYVLYKVVNGGTPVSLGAWNVQSDGAGIGYTGVFRLEADTSAVRLKVATTHGGTYSTVIAASNETSLSGGRPGLYCTTSSTFVEDWYGGDL